MINPDPFNRMLCSKI